MLDLLNLERTRARFMFSHPNLFFCCMFFLVPIVGLAVLALAVFTFSWPLCIMLEKFA